jgi:hypothetical protein
MLAAEAPEISMTGEDEAERAQWKSRGRKVPKPLEPA